MEKLRTPFMINAIYLILLGLSTLTPSLAQSAFGYEVKDPGVLLVLSGLFFASASSCGASLATPSATAVLRRRLGRLL